jgi:hypothetical protein
MKDPELTLDLEEFYSNEDRWFLTLFSSLSAALFNI